VMTDKEGRQGRATRPWWIAEGLASTPFAEWRERR
jgi:hypothetical protein